MRTYRAGGFDDAPSMEGAAPSPSEPSGRPLLVPQNLTEAVLRERLAELRAAPTYGRALAAFDQDDEGDRVLIRPDGYVAAVVSQADEGALFAYLRDLNALDPSAPAPLRH